MDIKCAFLNGFLDKEVFVEQPLGFENPLFSDHVNKLDKAHYRLKQAPRQRYERLSKFLIENNFVRGKINKTLFFKNRGFDIWMCKFMLMILFLVPPMNCCVKNLLILRVPNLK